MSLFMLLIVVVYIITAIILYRSVTSGFFYCDSAAIYNGILSVIFFIKLILKGFDENILWISLIIGSMFCVVVYTLMRLNVGYKVTSHSGHCCNSGDDNVSDYLSYREEELLKTNADLIERLERSTGGVNTPHDIYDSDGQVDFNKVEQNNADMQTELDMSRD